MMSDIKRLTKPETKRIRKFLKSCSLAKFTGRSVMLFDMMWFLLNIVVQDEAEDAGRIIEYAELLKKTQSVMDTLCTASCTLKVTRGSNKRRPRSSKRHQKSQRERLEEFKKNTKTTDRLSRHTRNDFIVKHFIKIINFMQKELRRN